MVSSMSNDSCLDFPVFDGTISYMGADKAFDGRRVLTRDATETISHDNHFR